MFYAKSPEFQSNLGGVAWKAERLARDLGPNALNSTLARPSSSRTWAGWPGTRGVDVGPKVNHPEFLTSPPEFRWSTGGLGLSSKWLAQNSGPTAKSSTPGPRVPLDFCKVGVRCGAIGAEPGAKRPEFYASPPEFQWNLGRVGLVFGAYGA